MTETETRRVLMRHLSPAEAVTTWGEVAQGYSRDEAMIEAQRSLDFDLTKATDRCPFDVDVPRFVRQVADGDFDAAMATILEAHVWPGVFGRACHKYCEMPFRAGPFVPSEGDLVSEGVATPNISGLEWAVATYGNATRAPFTPGAATGRRVAVVGGGSAGLGCAFELRRLGHDVDIFEREPVPGGLLITGYPTFRMDKDIVKRENDPAEWGARLHLNHVVDGAELKRLEAEYDALFIGLGRTPLRTLDIEGDDLNGVLTCLDVLTATWYGRPPTIGPRVLVVGAGFSAMDMARTAIRMGCSPVEIVYRRGVDDMLRPGFGRVIARTLEAEGIRFRFMADPTRLIGEGGRVVAAELIEMEYVGGNDETGRAATRPVLGTEQIVPVDTVIRAIGEVIDVAWIRDAIGVELTESGVVQCDAVSRQTSNPKVWVGGDAIGHNGNETAANDGMWAARAMDAAFKGRLTAWREESAPRNKDLRF